MIFETHFVPNTQAAGFSMKHFLLVTTILLSGLPGKVSAQAIPAPADRKTKITGCLEQLQEHHKIQTVAIATAESMSTDCGDTVETTARAVSQALNATFLQRDKVLLIYRLLPPWLEETFKNQPEKSPTQAALLTNLLTALSPEQLQQLQNGSLDLGSLNPEQRKILRAILQDVINLGPDDMRREETAQLTRLMGNKASRLNLGVSPSLFIYRNDQWLGEIIFSEREQKWNFRHRKAPHAPEVGRIGWDKPPGIIQPKVELTKEDAGKTLQLTTPVSTWSLGDLVNHLQQQSGLSWKYDPRLQNVLLHISGKQWTLKDLVEAISVVTGCEVRRVGSVYFMAPSSVHMQVGWQLFQLQQLRQERMKLLQAVQPIIEGAKFARMSQPFSSIQFNALEPVDVKALTEEQQNLILSKIPTNPLPTSYKSSFIPLYSLDLVPSSEDKDAPPLGYATYVIDVQPWADLVKPANSTWREYPNTLE
jgi:hypothetical protein